MGILDGGVPIPSYDPQAESRAHTLIGLKIADNFLEQYNKEKDRSLKERQFNLDSMLAQTQMTAANSQEVIKAAQIEGYGIRNQQDALALSKNVNWEEQKKEALAFEGVMGGDYSQSNQVRFLDFLKQNPKLADTPWANEQRDLFGKYKLLDTQHKFEMEKLQEQETIRRAERDRMDAEIEHRIRLRDALQAEKDTNTQIVKPGGVIDEDALAQARQKTSLEQKSINAQNLPQAEMARYTAPKSVLDKSQRMAELVDEADKRGNAFWFGYEKLANSKEGANIATGLNDKDQELARQILQQWNDLFATKGFGTAGKNFTMKEMDIVKSAIGDPNKADFPRRIRDMRGIVAEDILGTLEDFQARGLDKSPKYKGMFQKGAAQAFGVPGARERWKKRSETLGIAPDTFGMDAGTNAPPAAASPVPPSQREVGKVYDTPRGPMKWTGTGWIPQ